MLLTIGSFTTEVDRTPVIKDDEIRISVPDSVRVPSKLSGAITLKENFNPNSDAEMYTLYRSSVSDWLRYTLIGNTILFTNTPETVPPTEDDLLEIAGKQALDKRDSLLSDTNWTQLLDTPISKELRDRVNAYRKALREIESQSGFPNTINWPEKPEVSLQDVKSASDTIIALEAENKLLTEQVSVLSSQNDFQENLIVELANVVYA